MNSKIYPRAAQQANPYATSRKTAFFVWMNLVNLQKWGFLIVHQKVRKFPVASV